MPLPPYTPIGLKHTGEEEEEKTSEAGSDEYQESFQELPLLQVRDLQNKYEAVQCVNK